MFSAIARPVTLDSVESTPLDRMMSGLRFLPGIIVGRCPAMARPEVSNGSSVASFRARMLKLWSRFQGYLSTPEKYYAKFAINFEKSGISVSLIS